MKSELNKELLDAISLNVDTDWNDDYGAPKAFYNKCADECEIIFLEKQIEYLDRTEQYLLMSAKGVSWEITELKDRLNKLKDGTA